MTSDAIKRHRLERGWTQLNLADLVGTTHPAVSHWEKGIRTPRPRYLRRLEAVFGLESGALESETVAPASDRL